MGRKKSSGPSIFEEDAQIEACIKVLRNAGYGILKVEQDENVKEAERVEELKALGYKVEHYKDTLVKVDPSQITSADDVVVYFYERLRRSPYPFIYPEKLKDKKARAVDRSVVNSLVLWRTSTAKISTRAALEEVFIMIDTLFEKAEEWKLKIDKLTVLSINYNKGLVVELLRLAHLKQDKEICYKVDQMKDKADLDMYVQFMEEAKERLDNTESKTVTVARKKVKL